MRAASIAELRCRLTSPPLAMIRWNLAIYRGIPTARCVGQDVARQCHLCPVGKSLGVWESKRGSYVFTPKEM